MNVKSSENFGSESLFDSSSSLCSTKRHAHPVSFLLLKVNKDDPFEVGFQDDQEDSFNFFGEDPLYAAKEWFSKNFTVYLEKYKGDDQLIAQPYSTANGPVNVPDVLKEDQQIGKFSEIKKELEKAEGTETPIVDKLAD